MPARFLALITLAASLLAGTAVLAQDADPAPAADEKKPLSESYERLFDNDKDAGKLTDKEIKVAAGDTLQSISLNEFFTIGLWRHIAEYNQLLTDAPLSGGQIIKIPRIYYRPREFAEIIYVHGENLYKPADGSETRVLERNDQLFFNDEIRTGENGFANVLFRSGATINLQPSSHVRLIKLLCLETDPQCFIELQSDEGDLIIDVPAASDAEQAADQENLINIETPHAAAAVRGTNFDINTDSQSMLLAVTSGIVAVVADSDEVDLQQGFGIKAAQGMPLGEPIELLPATSIHSVPARLSAGERLRAEAIDGAIGYYWTLSSDQSASRILSQTQSTKPEFALELSEAGVYFVHVRGIDVHGLKGFSSSQRISVVGLDHSFDTLTLEAVRENQDLIISVSNPQQGIAGYEIQLAKQADFIEPISVEVGTAGSVIFSDQQDSLYIRARGLIRPDLITPFGQTLTLQ